VIAISVENVSKKFILSHDRTRNVADAFRGMFKRTPREVFWALKDVGFRVEQGEALGIIGHNGAGKSTMLKLLTRIMEPSDGRLRTRGRVSALIEVGAGFHPEMSGRENVYLNGSILGMSRREIDGKFDEIVAFAGLEHFIDTPVKRYSSGMYARLGFAVIAHLEPEILLVDEVLSVGDEAFQVKCQERMSSLMRSGATVLFVSHNLPAVAALCSRCLVLHHGELVIDTDSAEAIRGFRKLQIKGGDVDQSGDDLALRIASVRVTGPDGGSVEEVRSGDPIVVEIAGRSTREMGAVNFAVEIVRADGVRAYDVNGRMDDYLPDIKPGAFTLKFEIDQCNLADGTYSVSVGAMDRDEHVHYQELTRCAYFSVRDPLSYRGIARLGHRWNLETGQGS